MVNQENNNILHGYQPYLYCVSISFLFFLFLKINVIALNLSASMPMGVYHLLSRSTINHGNIVSSCLPKQIASEGLKRAYLTKGKCPNGAIPVAKLVIAVPGDNVVLTQDGITVNGKFYPAPHSNTDHNGLPITQFAKIGKHSNTQGYWLYGAHAPESSWDSRYFGAVDRQYIINVLQPVLVF